MTQRYDECIEDFRNAFSEPSSLDVLERLIKSLDEAIAKEILLGDIVDFRSITKKPLSYGDISILLLYYRYIDYPGSTYPNEETVFTKATDMFRLGYAVYNVGNRFVISKNIVMQYENLITKLKGE